MNVRSAAVMVKHYASSNAVIQKENGWAQKECCYAVVLVCFFLSHKGHMALDFIDCNRIKPTSLVLHVLWARPANTILKSEKEH